MSKVISFRDLKLADELAHLSEVEMLYPSNDELVNNVLEQCGFDLDYPIVYLVANHRDMQNKIAIGFRAVGEITLNRKYLDSPVCATIDRIAAAAYQDVSLAKELAELMNKTIDFKAFSADIINDVKDQDFPSEMIEDNWEEVSKQIKSLENVRDMIRGSMFNDAGDLKMPDEYTTPLAI